MASQFSARSDWNQSETQAGQSGSRGPRGAVWVIAALYVFSAIVFASWFGPWADDSAQTAAPPAQHQHSTRPTQG
jgi:hypothetical protein